MALTYDWRALNSKVDALQPVGMTNQTIGLQWGFQSLTAAPFNIPPEGPQLPIFRGHHPDDRRRQHREPRSAATRQRIDARTTRACDNVKAAGITLYTIQVNTDGTPAQEFLRDCASTTGQVLLVTSPRRSPARSRPSAAPCRTCASRADRAPTKTAASQKKARHRCRASSPRRGEEHGTVSSKGPGRHGRRCRCPLSNSRKSGKRFSVRNCDETRSASGSACFRKR